MEKMKSGERGSHTRPPNRTTSSKPQQPLVAPLTAPFFPHALGNSPVFHRWRINKKKGGTPTTNTTTTATATTTNNTNTNTMPCI